MNEEKTKELNDLRARFDEISSSLDNLINSNERKPSKSLLYEERRHFEDLFTKRISLQLVFSSLFLFAVYRGVEPTSVLTIPVFGEASLQRILLIVGTVVSIALSQAVFRTYQFVTRALDEIIKKWPRDPYPRYKEQVWYWNANLSLLGASFVLTLLFLFLAVYGES